MKPRNGWTGWLNVVIVFLSCTAMARADVITLKNGGEIRGLIQKKPRTTSSKGRDVIVKTLSGSLVAVSQSEIESIQRRRLILEEYETQRRNTPDTVDGHWELAQWCRNQRLTRQRRTHLKRIVELNPQHEQARRSLGHQKYDGEWMSREEYMKSQGQVLYRGRYVFPQELEQIKQDQLEKEGEREWHKKVKLWHAWITSDRTEQQKQAFQELSAITDTLAIPALSKRFRDSPHPALRELYISILGRMQSAESLQALLYQAIFDSQPNLREVAVTAIPETQTNTAITALVRGLKSELNLVVCRSATALALLGNDQVVPQLIDALVTTHRYRVVVPDNGANTIGFAANGGQAPLTSGLPPDVELQLMTGQLPYGAVVIPPNDPGAQMRQKTQIVKRTQRNGPVLEALKSLTDEDFSYNRPKWRLWWAEKNNNVVKP
ncbi:HEAT repeat domain-containing protein [Symmachiella dynata]|uniref:HEAT repeat domain-containing protein n=1 Tax=Symmachiella dynata TaxID=2527995 RepID=UPI0030EB2A38